MKPRKSTDSFYVLVGNLFNAREGVTWYLFDLAQL